MSNFKKYPDIEQFRTIIKAVEHRYSYYENEEGEWVRNPSANLPTIDFNATVKMHGTNAGIRVSRVSGEDYMPQSRRRDISIERDNAGFAAWLNADDNTHAVDLIVAELDDEFPEIVNSDIIIFGEWCGGNIAKNISLSDLPKSFIIFGVEVIGENDENSYWLADYPILYNTECNIHDVRHFYNKTVSIDFNNPALVVNDIINMTIAVEDKCPVGAALKMFYGIESTNEIGEGVVLTGRGPDGAFFMFKSKGEKHQNSKVKTLTTVDVEKMESVAEFVEYAVTENRMEQMALESVGTDFDVTKLGLFLKAVAADVLKEESDTLSNSGLCMKDVGKYISRKARVWFFDKGSIK